VFYLASFAWKYLNPVFYHHVTQGFASGVHSGNVSNEVHPSDRVGGKGIT